MALSVIAGEANAGRLERSDRALDTVLFTYEERCPPERAVSLTMPVRADQYDALGCRSTYFDFAAFLLDFLAVVGTGGEFRAAARLHRMVRAA